MLFRSVAYVGAFTCGVTGAVFGTITITALQQTSPQQAHGRIMGVTTAINSWVETLALPVGAVTLATLGTRAGAVTLAGVAVLAGLTYLTITARDGNRAGSGRAGL